MRYELHFPTSIFVDDFPDMTETNARIVAAARARAAAEDGVRRTNVGGYQSEIDFFASEECRPLVERLDQAVAAVRDVLHVKQPLVIGSGWVNINRKGNFNARHIHPRAYLSGVYYLQGGDESGEIVFHSPLIAKEMTDPDFDDPPPFLSDIAFYRPAPGRCLIFPAWLEHSVFPNRTDDDRISVSFNVIFPRREYAIAAGETGKSAAH
jgi:uncharacterized protein (TIGR02466 family)